jgi:hypothetical protein
MREPEPGYCAGLASDPSRTRRARPPFTGHDPDVAHAPQEEKVVAPMPASACADRLLP